MRKFIFLSLVALFYQSIGNAETALNCFQKVLALNEVSAYIASANRLNPSLKRAHDRFVAEGGDLQFDSGAGYPHFRSPLQLEVPPAIVLLSPRGILNGDYQHELNHFRNWSHTKKTLLQKNTQAHLAHGALAKALDESDPARVARTTQYLEDAATKTNETYAQFEAIRRLDLGALPTQFQRGQSKVGDDVIGYTQEALRKMTFGVGVEAAQGIFTDKLILQLSSLRKLRNLSLQKNAIEILLKFRYQTEFFRLQQDLQPEFLIQSIFDPQHILLIKNEAHRQNLLNFVSLNLKTHMRFIALREETQFRQRVRAELRSLELLPSIIDTITTSVDRIQPVKDFLKLAEKQPSMGIFNDFETSDSILQSLEKNILNKLSLTAFIHSQDFTAYEIPLSGEAAGVFFLVTEKGAPQDITREHYKLWHEALSDELYFNMNTTASKFTQLLEAHDDEHTKSVKDFIGEWRDTQLKQFEIRVRQGLESYGCPQNQIENILNLFP